MSEWLLVGLGFYLGGGFGLWLAMHMDGVFSDMSKVSQIIAPFIMTAGWLLAILLVEIEIRYR